MTFLLSYLIVCILFVRDVSPGPVVVTTILNRDVFKTGVSEYGMYPFVQALNISCDISSLPIAGRVELLHESRLVQIIEVPEGGPSRLIFTYLLPTDLPTRSRLVCSLQVSHEASLTRGSLDYVVEDSVLLNVWPESEKSRCISDIGYAGTSRETALITCIRASRTGDAIEFGWRGINNRRQWQAEGRALVRSRVSLDESLLEELVCIDPVLNEEICRLPRITVTADPTVSITPADDFVSDTEIIEFTCTSDPPARVRWLVFGDHGDILADSLETFIVPESILSISMTTNSRSSRLRVMGRTVLFSNIHTVMCTTDDRGFFRVAVSMKKPADTVTMTVMTTGAETYHQSTQGRSKGDMDTVEAGDDSPVYIIVIVILVLVVIGLLVACVLLYMRARRTASETGPPGNSGPYVAYHAAASGSPTYMDVHAPGATRENDYTRTDGQGYEIPKT